MLAAYCNNNEESSSCAKLLGTVTPKHEGGLICESTSLIISSPSSGGLDTCSFLSEPSDAAIMAFCESAESCGSIAMGSGESCGSIAFSGGGESCGSIASSSGGGFSGGGGCSYSC